MIIFHDETLTPEELDQDDLLPTDDEETEQREESRNTIKGTE